MAPCSWITTRFRQVSDGNWINKCFESTGFLFSLRYDDTLAKVCQNLTERWVEWSGRGCPQPVPFLGEDLASFSSDQIQQFLGGLVLANPLSLEAVKTMQQLYKLDDIQNCEVKFR